MVESVKLEIIKQCQRYFHLFQIFYGAIFFGAFVVC